MSAIALPVGAGPEQSFLRNLAGVDPKAAHEWLDSLLGAARSGLQLWDDAQLVHEFLQQCSRTGSTETRQGYARELRWLRGWLDEHHPHTPLRALDPSVAEQILSHLRSRVADGEMAARSFNRRIAVFSSLWRWAAEPCRSGVTGFLRSIWGRRLFFSVDKESRPLHENEMVDLTGAVAAAAREGHRTAKRDLIIVRSAYLLGCRVSELRNLKWGDIERLSDGGLVTIRRGKGGKSRTIRVSLDTLSLLESLGRGEADEWLFPSNRRPGAPLTRQAIGDRVSRWGRRIGLHVYMHKLRHTHATTAIRIGCDVFTLMHTLGHRSSSTTQNYVAASPADSSSLRLG